ncbi:MAG: lipid-A-disaccharide synthase N-terminal domain-containing protein [Acidobacteriota bacterium]|jgi:lipid-A-disaccharide synthase-like uncharacterized protein
MTSFFRADLWELVGLGGQLIFGSRFYVQILASERRKRSYFPMAFWYLSLVGGAITLAYAVHLRSLPFTLAQAGGLLIYARNLVLIRRGRTPAPSPPVAP